MMNERIIDLNAFRNTHVADIESGYSRISNAYLEHIAQLDVSSGALRMILLIIRKTFGFQKSRDLIANTVFEKECSLSASTVKDSINTLLERNVITVQKSGRFKLIGLNKNVSEWVLSQKKKEAESISGTAEKSAIEFEKAGNPAIEQPENRLLNSRKSGYTKEKKDKKKDLLNTSSFDGASADVIAVFEHWKRVMQKPAAKLTAERLSKIQSRLAHHPVEKLIMAIDGCASSDFHMARTPNNQTLYNDIELIFRNETKFERFVELAIESMRINTACSWSENLHSGSGLF